MLINFLDNFPITLSISISTQTLQSVEPHYWHFLCDVGKMKSECFPSPFHAFIIFHFATLLRFGVSPFPPLRAGTGFEVVHFSKLSRFKISVTCYAGFKPFRPNPQEDQFQREIWIKLSSLGYIFLKIISEGWNWSWIIKIRNARLIIIKLVQF